MNWLYVGLPLAAAYVLWFAFILIKRKYNKYLLAVGLAHIPYLLVNLVAPFRGMVDNKYAGYTLGWLSLPKGPWVTIVVGFMVISCLIIASRALLNKMDKLWEFAFVFDLMLSVMIAFPVFYDTLIDPIGSRIQLGEYLNISGLVVAAIFFFTLSAPTFYATYYAGKQVWNRYFVKFIDVGTQQ